jgi:hypothetical protein
MNIDKSATETLAMIRQAFLEENMSRSRLFESHARSGQTEKGESGEEAIHAQDFL